MWALENFGIHVGGAAQSMWMKDFSDLSTWMTEFSVTRVLLRHARFFNSVSAKRSEKCGKRQTKKFVLYFIMGRQHANPVLA
jgi:hypothetical protein